MDLLAILGRGVRHIKGSDPWFATDEREICAPDFSHLPECEIGVIPDDYNPRCLVGGSKLNLEAGMVLIRKHAPKIVVCAYGPRAPYLERVNGPSESEVMSANLRDMIRTVKEAESEIVVWPRTRTMDERSNTYTELRNILELALERGVKSVGVVTVTVHLPRVITMMSRHLQEARYAGITVSFFAPIALQLFRSLAFGRTAALELSGTTAFLENRY